MTVRGRNLRSRGDVQLENRNRTSRSVALDLESNRQLLDPDLFAFPCRHRCLTPSLLPAPSPFAEERT
jgi:hypothetical protein